MSEAPMQRVSVLGETLDLRPFSVAGLHGDQKTQEDSEVMDPGFGEQTLPKAGPVNLLILDQPSLTSADTQTPLDKAADVPTSRHKFLSAIVDLGAP